MIEEIMKELAQLGKVYYYVPKSNPCRMISTTTEDTIISTLLCVEEGIYHWVELPEGKFIQCNTPNCWILLVNDIYYFMD